MGIASFVIGLICLIASPFLNIFLIIPAIIALILGIVDVVKKSKKKQSKGLSIAGIVLSSIAIASCIFFLVLIFNIFNLASDSINGGILDNDFPDYNSRFYENNYFDEDYYEYFDDILGNRITGTEDSI